MLESDKINRSNDRLQLSNFVQLEYLALTIKHALLAVPLGHTRSRLCKLPSLKSNGAY